MQPQPVQAPRSLKERQRQEREALILQVAEEVLAEKGYHETSIEEIAARVGVAKGTVYLHFPSKEELVAAIFERDVQKFLQEIEVLLSSERTPRAKMEAILQFMYSEFFIKRARLLYTIFNSHSAELRRLFLEKKGHMRDLWERLSTNISALLEQGKAVGEFDPTIPTPVMVSVFFSLLSARGFERLAGEERMSSEELATYLSSIYFKGIAAT